MSATTSAYDDTAFRKIDIDALEEDYVTDAELYDVDPRSPEQALADAQAKQDGARNLLNRGDAAGALALILSEPPYGPTVEDAKNITIQALLSILSSTRTSDIPNLVRALDPEQQDTLMKYIYKGMALPGAESSGSVLLSWHEKLTEVAGTGCIVRVMTDRRLV